MHKHDTKKKHLPKWNVWKRYNKMTHVFIDPLRWLRKFHILFEQFIIWKIGYVFLSYLYKEQVSWFFSFKKHTQHKEFLERKLQWWFLGSEKRIRRKGNSILFFYSIFCLLFWQPVNHQIHRKLRSFNGQLRALLLYKIKTAAPLSALSPPSHLLPNPTTENRSAVWLSRRQTDLLFFRHFLDFEFEFHEISS